MRVFPNNADYQAWFRDLQSLSEVDLDEALWIERWFDGYTPAQALVVGPVLEWEKEHMQ